MREKCGKCFSIFLCGVAIFILFCISVPAYADGGVMSKLNSLRSKFPDGKYWNHLVTSDDNNGNQLLGKWVENDRATAEAFQNSVTSAPCAIHTGTALIGQYDCNVFDGGMQCCGFAKKIFYDVFGVKESSNQLIQHPGYAGLMPGDFVKFNFNHYAVVLTISGSKFTVVECNLAGDPPVYPEYACMIRWGREYDLSQIQYYVHAPNYDQINGGGGYTPAVNVSFDDWEDEQYTYIGTTDAAIGQAVSISGGTCTETGMYLYDSVGNYLAMARQLVEYHDMIYFKINEECGYTLIPDHEYRYKFYAVVDGKTYWSNMGSFRTKPNAVGGRVVWDNMSCLSFKKSAYISANVSSSTPGTFTEVGLKIWDQSGALIAQKIEDPPHAQNFRVWYEVLSETGCALQTGTKYVYQLSARLDGIEYVSEKISFTTETASERHFGIDVSYAQGVIDWDTVAPYIDFAIIRCGYAGNYTSTDDVQWNRNVAECERLGIPYGVYLYSYAENDAEALGEAEHVLRLLRGHSPSLPVYYDLEDPSTVGQLSNEQIASQVQVFSTRISQAGYKVGIYASASWWNGCLAGLSIPKDCRWYAAWDSSYVQEGSNNAVWQFTSGGHIPGISNSVDLNYSHAYRFGTIYPEHEKQYKVTYDANGGSNAPAAQTKTDGVTLKLSTDVPTLTGYTFLGWAESPTAITAQYQAGGDFTGNRNATLYAVWKANTYDVRYDANGGVGTIPNQTKIHGQPLMLTTIQPTRSGYVFMGWGLDDSNELADYHPYQPGDLYIYNNDIKLYAVWTSARMDEADFKAPVSLLSIEESAFEGLNMTVVTLPDNLQSIGSRAFANCKQLRQIYIPASVTDIASDAFTGCRNDLMIYGSSGSSAQSLAKWMYLPFVPIDTAHDISDWTLYEDLPDYASIIEEKWTYDQVSTEKKTSTASSMPGYTQTGFTWRKTGTGTYLYASYPDGFDHSHSLYAKFNKNALPSSASTGNNTKREASSGSFKAYIYWHWTHTDVVYEENRNVLIADQRESSDHDYFFFDAFETSASLSREGMTTSGLQSFDGLYSTYHYPEYNLPEYASWWWYRFPVYQQTYTDYQKLFTYQRTITEALESQTSVAPAEGITNIRHWVKYIE